MSPHAWVCIAQDRWILTNSNGSYIKLERNFKEEAGDDQFLITEIAALSPAISKSPFSKPRKIAKALTFDDAIHAADTYAAKKYPFQFISRSQRWRNKPATEGQLAFLNKLRPKDDQLGPDSLTKGRAGDMITKLKHGARGRFATLEADKRRQGKARLKQEQERVLREREKVSVGPLLD